MAGDARISEDQARSALEEALAHAQAHNESQQETIQVARLLSSGIVHIVTELRDKSQAIKELEKSSSS